MLSLDHAHVLPADALRQTDPVELNLAVARSIPQLAQLDIVSYQQQVDDWASDLRQKLVSAERQFWVSPQSWKGDIRFFRLGFLCWYVDEVLGVRYREDQKEAVAVWYTDPSDLFLNGIIDTRRGTCANMAVLHVALAWRLGWALSLACAWSHVLARYDDGTVCYNIEASNTGTGGFSSPPDSYYCKRYNILPRHIEVGSDLSPLKPRQMLGLFSGFRARYWQDTGCLEQAGADYALARELFPQSRYLDHKLHEAQLGRFSHYS